MARKRQFDPCYPFEKEIAKMSIPARYFYLMSWTQMDDTNGVMPYEAFFLKTQIFPDDGIDAEVLIRECIDQKRLFPFEAENKRWLWCPTFLKHQTINHPSKRRYPDPPATLREDYCSDKGVLPQSRVERVERDDTKDQPSEKLKAALDKVLKDGFNIYELIGRLKKEMGWPKDRLFPEEVLLGVCESYEKGKTKIKDQWAWFKVAIRQESEKYFAAKNIDEHRKIKETGPMSMGDLLRKAQGRCG